ncbi:MAG: YqgE/AlgH family protein, partial [Aestuariivirga sp.]
MTKRGFLKGKLLIAMPSIQGDDFSHSVVFVCDHSKEGAMGLVLNKPAPRMIFSDLVEKLDLGEVNRPPDDEILQMPLMLGGPVKQFQGFVLHSSDYKSDETLKVAAGYALTATVDVLKAIAAGKGPKRKILALGYAGWSAGQLEDEILRNGWLTCDADADLVFSGEHAMKHEAALKKLGV